MLRASALVAAMPPKIEIGLAKEDLKGEVRISDVFVIRKNVRRARAGGACLPRWRRAVIPYRQLRNRMPLAVRCKIAMRHFRLSLLVNFAGLNASNCTNVVRVSSACSCLFRS